jgi:ferric-dicitrate binding protein FerR (iron transport regulator)
MRSINTISSTILAVLVMTAAAPAQPPAGQIGSVGGFVEVLDASGSVMGASGQLLSAPEIIRTGSGSFVDLVLAGDGRVLLDTQSQIEIRRLGASPLVWLESGKVTVTSQRADVHIQTKFGLFSAAEWPFEMELINSGGTLNVVVVEGRIRTQNLDTSVVTFGVSGSKGFRTYTAGSINPRVETTTPSPNLFLQPCLAPGNASVPGYSSAPNQSSPGPTSTAPSAQNPSKPVLGRRTH